MLHWKHPILFLEGHPGSNRGPLQCDCSALNQLGYAPIFELRLQR